MNLYQIEMQHYAPKGSAKGLLGFLVAENDNEVYEWLKNEPKDELNDFYFFNSYKYYEEEGELYDIYDKEHNVIGNESYKDRMIRLQGELNDDEIELNDLYYGKTLFGWKLIKENVPQDEIDIIQNLNIPIHFAKFTIISTL